MAGNIARWRKLSTGTFVKFRLLRMAFRKKLRDCIARMTSLVVIPQNYEDLPEEQREQIIPICMAARDRKGQLIEPRWFFEGVAPVRKHLVSLAHYALGDPWCVSELAEATVHRLWSRYGTSVGRCPWRRVLKKAIWMAEELRIGDWRKRKYPNLYLGLDGLDQKIREQMLVDPSTYVDLLEQQIMLDSIEERLEQQGRAEMRLVFQLLRRGYSWQEIAEHLGETGREPAKRRFYRWLKKAASE
jgi:hypothetical protein